MAFLSFKFYDFIVIFGTSFIGAFGIIRGIAFIAGAYPSEWEIVSSIKSGEPIDLPW